MSAFTQGFNIGIMQGMANMYAGLCNFWGFNAFSGFGGFWGFGSPGLYTYSSPLNYTPSLFASSNYGGFGGYQNSSFSADYNNMYGFSSPFTVSSVFTPQTSNFSAGFDVFSNSQILNSSYNNSDTFNTKSSSVSSRSEASKTKHSSNKKTTGKRSNINNDMNYETMLNFVLKSEGGYTPDDCGQAGNKGVQQSTYNAYRKSKNLSTRDVKNITDEEVKDLYYTMYYVKSGADKIEDKRLALYVFDTAVNMGVSAAKDLLNKSGNDPEKFEQLRIAKYEAIAQNDDNKKKYLKGWKNRVANAREYADNQALA